MISQLLPALSQTLLAAGDLGKQIPDLGVSTQQTNLGATKGFEIGGLTTGIGMIVVFIGLIFLILIITIMSAVLRDRKKKAAAPIEAPVSNDEAYAPTMAIEPVAEDVDDESEIAAVIVAALAMIADQKPDAQAQHPFVVRSIRRVGATSPAWNRAARPGALQSQP